MFKRSVYPTVHFGDIHYSEDYAFAKLLAKHNFRLKAIPDRSGLILHMIHNANMSHIFPQYCLPPFMMQSVFGPDFLAPTSTPAASALVAATA